MALELKQSLKLSQQLVITPQLKQAIKLLQLSHMDLVDQIQSELVDNPALEEIPGATSDEALSDTMTVLDDKGRAEKAEVLEQNNGMEDMENNWAGLDDATGATPVAADTPSDDGKLTEDQWRQALESYRDQPRTGAGVRGEELPPIESTLSSSTSLAEHLIWQLHLQVCREEERLAAEVIILNLDDRGYLQLPLEQIAEDVEVDIDDVEGAQMIVQGLDPMGCGSTSLAECLVIQAKARFPEDPFFCEIIRNHLGDFEKRNYQHVARQMDMHLEDVHEYHKMLQSFEPWPGRAYSDSDPRYITPDIYVFKMGEDWHIRQNEDGLPKLRISPYYQRVMSGGGSKEEREYIKGKLDSADFLIKSIYKRQATIYKVVRSILDRQRGFFEHGVEHLTPMILRDVADEIGVHESTVSRVTSNKYLQCPLGIFELKYFFNAGIRKSHGEDMAAVAVRSRIKSLVSVEDEKKPLSDSAIAKLLKAEGINCARRTVAKYREQLGILPSSKRKQMF